MDDTRGFQRCVKRAFFCLTDKLVGKLGAIVGLDGLDRKGKRFQQSLQKVHRVLWRMLFVTEYIPHAGAFVDGCPLV